MSPMRMLCCWCLIAILFAGVAGCQTWGGGDRYYYPDEDAVYRNSGAVPQEPQGNTQRNTQRNTQGKPESEVTQVNYEDENPAASPRSSTAESTPEKQDESWLRWAIDTNDIDDGLKRLRGTHKDIEESKKLYKLATEKFDAAAAATKQVKENPDKPVALSAYQRRKAFLEAAEYYRVAAIRWPDSALGEDAMFMSADSFFFAEHFIDAAHGYAQLVKSYPNSRHMDRVDARRFSMAQYWLNNVKSGKGIKTLNLTDERRPTRDEFTYAIKLFDSIRLDNPSGKLADDAALESANAYFQAKQFVRADEDYTYLRKTYPSSEHQFYAHFFSAKAKYESYLGPSYDAAVLGHSAELIERIYQIFPDDARKHDEELKKLLASVRFKQAEKEWTRAKFHENRGEMQGARFYYGNIVRDYPQTPFAEKAQEKLDSLADVTTLGQRFSWLSDLLDTSNDDPPLARDLPDADTTLR